jgi:ribose 5-phosphate isomerase B
VRIAIGADHAAFEFKQQLVAFLEGEGHDVVDLGTHSTDSVDYPDFAEAVGLAVQAGRVERGIMLCGSGVGASIVANKVRGVRAGLCHDVYSAHQCVEHDDVNVLVMGARVIGIELAKDLATTFLRARFTAESRHVRRLDKLKAVEARAAGAPPASTEATR